MRIIIFALSCLLAASCDQAPPKPAAAKNDSTVVVNAAANVPMFRESVKQEPAAQYQQRTDNPLNEWYFAVRLYETRKTFQYLIKLEYEEIHGQDTLKLPNFGTLPRPEIRKGPDKYSCIIGFLDKENQFREYKKVYVVGDRLKITALKHYAVATYQPEEESKD
jgi:hypothetical protein